MYESKTPDKEGLFKELNRYALREAYVQGQVSQGISESDAKAVFEESVGHQRSLSEIEELVISTVVTSARGLSPSEIQENLEL